jgi:hypothetical protein
MFPIFTKGHTIEHLVYLGHLLSEYAGVVGVHLRLRLHAVHLPYLQHCVLPARSQELPVGGKFSDPDCPVVRTDTLN